MSYYPIEKEGHGYLKGGLKPKYCNASPSSNVMFPCWGFNSKDICELFCESLSKGFEKIYSRYVNSNPILNQKVYWITTSSRTHLRNLVGQEDICTNPPSYHNNYTFMNESDRDKAMTEMQEYMEALYGALNKVDD